jgi:hypothetical protein
LLRVPVRTGSVPKPFGRVSKSTGSVPKPFGNDDVRKQKIIKLFVDKK